MENPNTDQSLFRLGVNDNLKIHLRSTAVVAGVAAILFLCTSIIKLVLTFMSRNKVLVQNRYEGFTQNTTSAERTGTLVWAVIWLIICILLFYFLNKFSTQTKAGLNANNQEILNNGLSGLSAYMITIGILLIIFLALMVLALMIGLTAGAR